jgi:hypothetical protein
VKVSIFIGPTLAASEARSILDATYLPPVAQGDVLRALWSGAKVIGIVDGYFESVPSVWHKEILWAMSQGVHVFGSASMGALRAAELSAFGMEGIGVIFEAFLSGELEDDDEVAVRHGPEESGYRAVNEPMVNIRATLAAATAAAVIATDVCKALLAIAKAMHYPDRSYPAVLLQAARQGLSPVQLERLRAWLAGGLVDQKRLDAVAMLATISDRIASGLEPKRVSFEVEQSKYWNRAMRAAAEPDPEPRAGGFDLKAALRAVLRSE